ncbi:MAG: flagellar basal body L-ring protein FlgH [Thioalkalivibrionaceae bacterium]
MIEQTFRFHSALRCSFWSGGRLALIHVAVLSLGLAGCNATNPPRPGDNAAFTPVMPAPAALSTQTNGSIFQAANARMLFEDPKARRVGDTLTVVLNERTQARKSANTSTSKESEVGLGNVNIFGRGFDTGVNIAGERGFTGAGDSTQSNQLSGEITVTVAEVLPNGNMVVQGEKWLGLNQGEEYIRLRGIVRPADVGPNNRVVSTQIADAQVFYGGTGALADANSQGWLTRFFNSPIWPF